MLITCKNIKISLNIRKPFDVCQLEKEGHSLLEKRQNFSFRVSGACVTVYKHSLHTLHATGIKSKSQLSLILKFVEDALDNDITSCRVDNSLFSFKNLSDAKPLQFTHIIEKIEKNSLYTYSYTPELFPALFLKPMRRREGFPTILLFTSGSVVLLGGKTIVKITDAIKMLKTLSDV